MNASVARTLLVLLLAAGLWQGMTPAYAVKYWKNGVTSGNWNSGNNWSATSAAGGDNGGVPVASEPVRVVHTDGTARTVTLDASTPTLGPLAIDLTGAGTNVNTLSITNNVNLTAASINVGGYSGTGATNGRGAIQQSAGTVTSTSGLDIALGNGAGSTGTYTLSGTGALNIPQSLYVGLYGTGTFNHSAGTVTVFAGAIGALDVGAFSGASGTYNLSGTGQLISNKSVYVGDSGGGSFFQTGGIHTIAGANDLVLGYSTGGQGTYAISAGTLSIGRDARVGVNGFADLNVDGTGVVNIANNLAISNLANVNLAGGTLRFNTVSGLNRLNYLSGTLQLAGNRTLTYDPTITYFFGTTPSIGSNKRLVVEGDVFSGSNSSVVSGGQLSTFGTLNVSGDQNETFTLNIASGGVVNSVNARIGDNLDTGSGIFTGVVNVTGALSSWNNSGSIIVGAKGRGLLNIINGGAVISSNMTIGLTNPSGDNTTDVVTVGGAGSSLTIAGDLHVGGHGDAQLVIENQASVWVGSDLFIRGVGDEVLLQGGTLRFDSLVFEIPAPDQGIFTYTGGTIQLAGSRTIGTDSVVRDLYGTLPVVPLGKGLTIEGAATLNTTLSITGGTFKANGLAVGSSGAIDFDRGILELTGGGTSGLAQLNIPTSGEFRAQGNHAVRIVGAAGSVITATGNLTLGNSTAVNGFGTQGTVQVGANTVALLDANDAVFDSLSLVTIGSGANPGTIAADNGLTLDFGGNITGYGFVNTVNTLAKPLINNGHIAGASSGQRLTLAGYVKGVGTFDNVNFTGTFSPGLSPTILSVGSIGLSNTSTLVMELGGTAPGSGYDQLVSSGSLALDGTLDVQLLAGFSPLAGQSFNLFDWISVSGAFDSLVLPSLGAGLAWDTSQLYLSGVLSVAAAGLPGDYNQDGTVDAADYTIWRDRLGSSTALANDDTPGVGQDDYNRWRAHFGQSGGSGAAAVAAIPEPASLALLAWVVVAGRLRGRRQTGRSQPQAASFG